jgi:hypothetical protein
MASSNFRKTASMSCGEADAYPAPIQADTVIQPPEEEVDPQFTGIKYMGNNARVKMILKYMCNCAHLNGYILVAGLPNDILCQLYLLERNA